MKKGNNIFNTLTLTLSFILLSQYSAFAQVSDKNSIFKSFEVNKGTIVDIVNKYGDISFETWDKDSISIEITYEVTEKNKERLRNKMKDIEFDISQSGHYIIINSIIGDSKNVLLSEFSKLKENIGFAESTVEINMSIKLPENLELRVKNKFGNIYIGDYKGDTFIDMSNGRLKANNLTGYANLKINFGDASINSIDTGNLEVYYSELHLSTSRKLRITSKTSDIYITEVEQLLVNSSRDDYRIRMIKDFETQANWTDFSITEFISRSDISMIYGELTIEQIQPSVEQISIDAKSTKINLYFDRKIDVNFDITTNRDLDLPMEAKIDSTVQVNVDEKIMRYLGRTGNIKKSQPKLVAKTKSANISILKR